MEKTMSGGIEWHEESAIGVDGPSGWVSVNDECTFTLPRMVMVPRMIATLTGIGQEALTCNCEREVRELIYAVRSVCQRNRATADQEVKTSVLGFLQGLR